MAQYAPGHPQASPDSGYIPPVETRFPPGVSGNPGGRKRGASPRAAYMRELARGWESDSEAESDDAKLGVKARELGRLFVDAVMRGDAEAVRAISEGINQADGKPQERIEHSGEGQGRAVINVYPGASAPPPLPESP